MAETLQSLTLKQFRAAMAMLTECIEKCPDDRWRDPVGKYPFWHVAYHALCFVDCYLSPSNTAFKKLVKSRAKAAFNPHPKGMGEFEAEHPSREFTRDELLRYAAMCTEKLNDVLTSESRKTLAGPSGFSWLKMSRAETHIYNLRHTAHHVGQLTATLRRAGVSTKWRGMRPDA